LAAHHHLTPSLQSQLSSHGHPEWETSTAAETVIQSSILSFTYQASFKQLFAAKPFFNKFGTALPNQPGQIPIQTFLWFRQLDGVA
jgi:hypothetical protein